MLVLTRLLDESIVIDDDIEVTIVEVRPGRVKLGVVAPGREAHRKEVWMRIQQRKEPPCSPS